MKRFGIDVGSLSIGTALLEDGKVVSVSYQAHQGDIFTALSKLLDSEQARSCQAIGVTGNFLSSKSGTLDNVLCVIQGAQFIAPLTQNIFSLGGQHFMLALYDEQGRYKEHTVNPPCASGTGSFIEQQAMRLKLSVTELAEKALAYKGKIPAIATRCAVFAKSDIVHAMQEGYSLDAVCAGLCQGIARTIIDSLLKGRKLVDPAVLVGGLSLNKKIVQDIQHILGIKVIVPQYSTVAGAVGAALLAADKKIKPADFFAKSADERQLRSPLGLSLSSYPALPELYTHKNGVEIVSPPCPSKAQGLLYLGIDIGSTSTKAVLLNQDKEIVKGFYTSTQGKPIEAVRLLIRAIKKSFGRNLPALSGVATTGSGRKMIKELFAADLAINEITAHAQAALTLHPEVDTIIEIGGQDSKFTLLKDGEVYYSHMNYVCAAGTGSFIEEQAKLLGISLEEFSPLALGARAPYTSDRCTVYMERDLAELKSRGFSKKELASAVLFSVRDNYLAKVVSRSPLGEHIVFQGATGRNQALVAAFEQHVKKPIFVSPYCHLTGALGAALLCMEKGIRKTDFSLNEEGLKIREEVCTLCSNNCLLTIAERQGKISVWGMKCGREYTMDKPKAKTNPDHPEARFAACFRKSVSTEKNTAQANDAIYLLDGLYNVEYNPLWKDFFERLGFKVNILHSSNTALNDGKELTNGDFCAPIVIAHGLLKQALAAEARHVFLPALVRESEEPQENEKLFKEKISDSYFCYYSQYLPAILSNLTSSEIKDRLISPLVWLAPGREKIIASGLYTELKEKFPYLSPEKIDLSFTASYHSFLKARKNLAQTFGKRNGKPSGQSLTVILLGRPYILFDPTINLAIAEKLTEQGADVYSMFELDIDGIALSYADRYYERMHWNYGQRILKAAEYAAKSSNTFIIFLSCFRCSPDSFLLSYVKDIMSYYEKPFLFLQLDEHARDTGYTTRLEAALESFKNYLLKKPQSKKAARPYFKKSSDQIWQKGDTVLVPYINRLMSRFWADCFLNAGFKAQVLNSTEKDLLTGYQYVNGGECMPAVAIVGGVIEKVKQERLKPEDTVLYIPTLCMACNFPQFPILAEMVFEKAGLEGLKVARINSMQQGEVLPANLSMKIFEAGVLASLIYKLYFRLRPYETIKGESDKVLARAEALLGNAFRQGQDVRKCFKEVCELFKTVAWNKESKRKPRIGILGDFYVKYNEVVNQNLQDIIQNLGAELVIPSFTESTFHFFDLDARINSESERHLKILRIFEQRYEKMAEDMLSGAEEPEWSECVGLLKDYGIIHYLPGETSINLSRALYSIANKRVEGIVHVNPMFCCPGVVSSSIFRKIQRDFAVPIVDLFYDGTGQPNKILIPYLHYLKQGVGDKQG
jgi:predicted CoA-substrate-specific enzyme activase